MGHIYHNTSNRLSRALTDNSVDEYLQKVGPSQFITDVLELVKFNCDVDRNYQSREEIALGFVYKMIDDKDLPPGKIVDVAYGLADQVIAKR